MVSKMVSIYDNLPETLKSKVDNLSPLNRRYAEHRAKGLSQGQAARMAGSQGDPKYLPNLGYQIEQCDGVKEYIQFIQSEKAKITPVDSLELTAMLRTVYERSMEAGSFKDANRSVELMGQMIGEFGKTASKAADNNKTAAEAFNELEGEDESKEERMSRVKGLLNNLNNA